MDSDSVIRSSRAHVDDLTHDFMTWGLLIKKFVLSRLVAQLLLKLLANWFWMYWEVKSSYNQLHVVLSLNLKIFTNRLKSKAQLIATSQIEQLAIGRICRSTSYSNRPSGFYLIATLLQYRNTTAKTYKADNGMSLGKQTIEKCVIITAALYEITEKLTSSSSLSFTLSTGE